MQSNQEESMTRRVIFNKKGGVGKTTIACNLAAISAQSGKKTLVIDMDPQGNASRYLMSERYEAAREQKKTIYDYFKATLDSGSAFVFNPFFPRLDRSENDLGDYLHETAYDNLWMIPSHPALVEIETQLVNRHKIYKLREALDTMKKFDAVFIDTPPALNFFSQSALIAASRCLIPFDCDAFSRDAINDVGQHIGDIQSDHNHDLHVEGIVVNQFMSRAKHPQEIVVALKADGLPILSTRLSSSVKIRESHQSAKPMIFLDPKHKLTCEFLELYSEIEAKTKNRRA
jgi:chromosome partitioning protein